MTEYEYEYYSAFQNWPNTNITGLSKNTINIFFVLAQQCITEEHSFILVFEH